MPTVPSTHRTSHDVTGRRRRFGIALTAILALLASATTWAVQGNDADWVGTWGASPQPAEEAFFPPPLQFDDQTIRTIARISKGGEQVRVRLTNALGAESLLIGAAHVAVHVGGGVIDPASDRALTFGGSPSIEIPPGAPALSDPVDLDVADLQELAISIYLPAPTVGQTIHQLGVQTTYISTPGDYTGAAVIPTASTTLSRFFVAGIDALADKTTRAVATLGDSITDGFASTPDANNRWPDKLAERLLTGNPSRKVAVVNQGISGNRVLNNIIGPNGVSRFDRDIIATTGVSFATVLLGINDIGFGAFLPAQDVSAERIIQGYRQLIARAHARCIKIIGGTLTPFEGAGYYSEAGEAKRQAVNDFIRNSGEFDGVIDFDAAIRDPANPTMMLPAYNSGDNLHPSDAGYDAMANAVDLSLFQQPLRDCEAAN
jgi:lysophospholipase L1-like esterase